MATTEQHVDPAIIERNTRRISRLITEAEKLIAVLEQQRLVSPTDLLPLKAELAAAKRRE
jgi:hypothetical protein